MKTNKIILGALLGFVGGVAINTIENIKARKEEVQDESEQETEND